MTRHDHTKHSMQGSHEYSIVEIVVSAFWCVFKNQFRNCVSRITTLRSVGRASALAPYSSNVAHVS
jgi:hypothetical protein